MFEQYLTSEQMSSIVSQRVSAHAQEGFQHELNLAVYEASGDDESAAASRDAIDRLEMAIAVETSVLDRILRESESSEDEDE